MKHFLLLVGVITIYNSEGQTVNLILDTIQYGDMKYYEGKRIRLGKGIAEANQFAHIKMGEHIDSLLPLPASFANQTLKVETVYKNEHGYVIVASAPENFKDVGYILIRVEQALASHELMQPKGISRQAIVNLVRLGLN
jgi:hypothetical protein